MDKIKTFEAHSDYLRWIAIHPVSPYLISCSDDMTIKMWDWEKGWELVHTFEGHSHYVMQVEFNPKDSSTFASASLDRTVKVWGITSSHPHFTLEGHERGVNCVSYYPGGDKPYLVSGADDQTVRIWDYQTKSCVAVLDGHTNNVSAVVFHPSLPFIISGGEDGSVRIWHATTHRVEDTLNYGMERVWSIACHKDSNRVAIGYDEGTVVVQMGQEEPAVSMDKSGKIVWSKNHELIAANIKAISASTPLADGERVPVATKEMGTCEFYPNTIMHDPKGRLIAVCGDSEYVIYTALSLKNQSFGSGLEFAWSSQGSGVYCVRESTAKIKIFKNFKESTSLKLNFPSEGIFGGALIGVRSTDFIDFFDWDSGKPIRRIEVNPKLVFWSETGEMVVIACENEFYVLRLNKTLIDKYLEQGIDVGDQGIDGSFTVEKTISEQVKSGTFVGDCFIYTNANGRLNYFIGGESITLSHMDKEYYVLGYLPKENRVYLMDRQYSIVSFSLLLSVLIFQTAIVRGDMETAVNALPQIPHEHYNRLARFLESQDLKEMALEVSQDPEHRFELALQLNKLDLAYEIAQSDKSSSRWKQLGDIALNNNDLELTAECYENAEDLGGLLLLATSSGNEHLLFQLAKTAEERGRFNLAFVGYFLLHKVDNCIALLLKNGRIPEAGIFARTYKPSEISRIVRLWRESLQESRPRVSESLADPSEHIDRFPDLAWALKIQEHLTNADRRELPQASAYTQLKDFPFRDLLSEAKSGNLQTLLSRGPGASPIETKDSTPVPQGMSIHSSEIKSKSPSASLGADLETDADQTGDAPVPSMQDLNKELEEVENFDETLDDV